MRTHKQLSSAVLALAAACLICLAAKPAFAGGDGPAAAKPRTDLEKRIYTNDDVDALAARFGGPAKKSSDASASAAPAATAAASSSAKRRAIAARIPDERNPQWYAAQMQAFEAQMARIDDQIRKLRSFRMSGSTSAVNVRLGLVLDAPCEGISTDNLIEQLVLQRREIEQRIGELSETSRLNDFPSGFIGGAAAIAEAPSAPPMTAAEQTASYRDRMDKLSEALAGVQGEENGMKADAAGRRLTLYPASAFGGGFTADLMQRLDARASEIQAQISATQDDARRAGLTPGSLR
ncbi:MAG: hypothetical protein WBP79_11350 [Candidatus Acidiferrales bacterium]